MLNPRQILDFAPWQDVRFGSKADICGAISHVRFTPSSDRESGFSQKLMSALPPKADIRTQHRCPLRANRADIGFAGMVA
jgi:hypothetical protein